MPEPGLRRASAKKVRQIGDHPVFCAAADLPGPGTDARIRPVQNSLGLGDREDGFGPRYGRPEIRAPGFWAPVLAIWAVACLIPAALARTRDAARERPVPAAAEFTEVLELDDVAAADQVPTHERTASAAFYGEAFDDDGPIVPLAAGPRGTNLFVAGHRTGAQRYSDFFLTNGKPRRRPLATSARLRRQDDANFTNRTRFLARRLVETGRPLRAPQLHVATTGAEFLDALVAASRSEPVANLVVYGHAAPNALFMREDRGFYGTVMEVAKVSRIVSGEDEREGRAPAACGRARPVGFRATREPRRDPLHAQRRDRVRGLRGRGKARHRPSSIAKRMAEITGAQGHRLGRRHRSIDGARARFPQHGILAPHPGCVSPERRNPGRLNTRVIDALREAQFRGRGGRRRRSR